MSRSSNDDRSDSKNPNNDAYWASESNRENQLGNSDGDYAHSPRPKVSVAMSESFVTRTYAFALLDFDGKAKCATFQTTAKEHGLSYTNSSIALSLFNSQKMEMNNVCDLGIAYARLWGPGVHPFVWYEGDDSEKCARWEGLKPLASELERKLQHNLHQDWESLGMFDKEVVFDDFDRHAPTVVLTNREFPESFLAGLKP